MSTQESIGIKQSDVVEIARLIKQGQYKQVYIKIQPDGSLEGRWFFGRSDFVRMSDLIILFQTDQQTEETLVYTIVMMIRNREGYHLLKEEN